MSKAWPTILSAARMAAAPVVAGLVLWAHAQSSFALHAAAAALFILAALTDLIDGWLARRTDSVTAFGAALDHAADKALVAGALVALAFTLLTLPFVIAAIILLVRDVAVAGLREGLSAAGRSLPVSGVGKAKAAFEMAGVSALLLIPVAAAAAPDLHGPLWTLALILVWAASLLALWSGAAYVRAALRPL